MRTGTVGASARNSSPSARVRFATERTPLAPEQLVREGRDVAHVDARAHDRCRPCARARSAAGTSSPTGAKMIAASSSSGGPARRVARPLGAERARERLRLLVARARDGEHARGPERRDLADDVRRGAEAVQPEPLARRRRAAASGSRSARRRGAARPGRRIAVRDREAVALVRDGELGVAAVEVVAREARAVAEVLAAGEAEAALAARPAEPGHADACPGSKRSPPATTSPTIWWPGTSGSFGSVELAVDDVQVGAADAAGADPEQHLARLRRRVGQLARAKRLAAARRAPSRA